LENAVGDETTENEEFRFQSIGEQLAAEREKQGLSLTDVATRTRVPMRHLEAIEKSDFASLPGTTYTLGFARSYARCLNMDAAKIGAELRAELSQAGHESYQAPTQNYEPADPSRVPPKALAWTAAALAILLLAGYLIWRSYFLAGAPTEPSVAVAAADDVATEAAPAQAAPAETPPPANGEVVLTAKDTVWIKVYGADRKRIFESEMKAGDKYTVPADANGPMIITGRPQMLDVTVGGKAVAPLGTAERTVSDVGLSAAALLARPAPPQTDPAATAPAAATPAPATAPPAGRQ
jgi:cytoskeletal protein RodZ